MDWKKSNKLVAAFIFLFTTIIYTFTVAPTVSFWDCGEFIATSYKMAVPHPPGAPFYLLVGRVFSLLPIGDDIAFRVNMISVLSSSTTIMLLYLVIVHLVREWKGRLASSEDWFTAIGSGIVGSLTFAFTHSFWFNAAEAEVYAASMLFTALLIWLSLVWAENHDKNGNEKYLLLIAYIIGLAIAVHLLNVLALPFVAMIYYFKKYEYNIKSFSIMTVLTVIGVLVIYPGVVKYLPRIAEVSQFLFIAFILAIFALTYWAVLNKKHLLSFIMVSTSLIIIGYASYGIIPIRSALNPTIDENNPETVEKFLKYINREQYGDHSITDREKVWKSGDSKNKYSSTFDFFWNYQINKMYIRYFQWQFVGMDEDSGSVNFRYFGIPLILGLLGMVYHFSRDSKHALATLALFVATGIAIVLYLNQPDPQPRERDYSYVGSFFAFSIWIGFGYAAIVEGIKSLFKDKSKPLGKPLMASVLVVLIAVSPAHLLAENYHSHNRTGNYVAWDYSYNTLVSCEENAILFTNGDNDTFPLWYLQEVEGIRKDVRIVNLSLLNTDWYIKQMRDMHPKVPMRVNDLMLEQVGPQPWETTEVSLKVPQEVSLKALRDQNPTASPIEMDLPKEISFTVKPTLKFRQYDLLRVQDYMILNILTANQWKRPVYFATTVPTSNLVGGLQDYMRMDGLVMRVVPTKNWEYSPAILEENLVNKYQYRFNDPNVYYNKQTIQLVQNYRTAFLTLAATFARDGKTDKLNKLMAVQEKNMPRSVIPWSHPVLRGSYNALQATIKPNYIDTMLDTVSHKRELMVTGQRLWSFKRFNEAEKIFKKLYENDPSDPELVGMYVQASDFNNNLDNAISVLENWLVKYPQDNAARGLLDRLKKKNNKG